MNWWLGKGRGKKKSGITEMLEKGWEEHGARVVERKMSLDDAVDGGLRGAKRCICVLYGKMLFQLMYILLSHQKHRFSFLVS